ncbi:hypothetical protein ACROYT_G026447 [Oculina patagonica]
MRLSLALFVAVALTIEKSSQDIYSDEDHDGKCTILASDDYHTTLEVNNENNNPKACGAVVKCHPNEMSISLPKSLLASIDRDNLQLLDPNCSATENSTHFVLTTTLIGCGTTSNHTEKSVVYSNRVRHVPPTTAVITRAPEVKIYFSCHYSKHGLVSTGAIRSRKRTDTFKMAADDFASNKDLCWNDRFSLYRRSHTCPAESTAHSPEQHNQQRHVQREDE